MLKWLIIGLMLAVGWVLTRGRMWHGSYSCEEAAIIVDGYCTGSISSDRWRTFIKHRATTPEVETARLKCLSALSLKDGEVGSPFPAPDRVTSELKSVVRELRSGAA